MMPIILSLYSTRTQNTWRRGVALGCAPNARILRYPTQNIPTCWYFWRWVTHIFRVFTQRETSSGVLPDAKPKRKPVEYRLRWVPTQHFRVGHVHFMFLCRFHLRLVANANPVSGGIWALESGTSIWSST